MNEPTLRPKMTPSPKQGISVRQITAIGIAAAAICILAPFSIPIGPVPISLTNLAIYFALYILGAKDGTLSYLIYLLIGFIGVPVFSGFTSGPEKLLGPTGGYLVGFIPMAILAGIVIDKFTSSRLICMAGMMAGTIIAYGLGTAWLAYQADMGLEAALFAGVVPFIPGDLAKMVLAMLIGPNIRSQLIRANLR